MPSGSLVLPQDLTACPMARAWTNERLEPLALDPVLQQDIVLCVDELVANVLSHTTSTPILTITTGATVLVEVADTSATAAELRSAGDGGPGGWGLRIIEHVADRWGSVPRRSGGKVVWFSVAT